MVKKNKIPPTMVTDYSGKFRNMTPKQIEEGRKQIAKIRKVIAKGGIVLDIPPMLEVPVKVGPWEFAAVTIGGVFKTERGEGFEIKWAIKGFGFGTLTFARRPDGRVECDNECMSREFVEAALKALAIRSKFYDEKVQ